jgi:hypothetical protein
MNFHSVPEASRNLHEISADYFSEVPVAVGSEYVVEAEIFIPRHSVRACQVHAEVHKFTTVEWYMYSRSRPPSRICIPPLNQLSY